MASRSAQVRRHTLCEELSSCEKCNKDGKRENRRIENTIL